MPRKVTTDSFIKRAREVHGDLYDYSRVDYINSRTKVLIVDPEYGEFWQAPADHTSGKGSPQRAIEERAKKRRLGVDGFVEKARKVHGNLYDYSKVVYKNNSTKVCIIDPEYGEFLMAPDDHLNGQNHPKRAYKHRAESTRSNTEEFIEKARRVHGTLYDYTKVEYETAHTPVCIIDPEYGEFWQTPNDHLSGKGNYHRGNAASSKKQRLSLNDFITRAREVHGDTYDYSEVDYKNYEDKVKIIDPEHGAFWQKPGNHLSGNGHPARWNKRRSLARRLTTEEFVAKAREVHGDTYDYSRVEYVTSHSLVEIVDQDYGSFWMSPNNHLAGQNHPKRACINPSKPEIKLRDWLDDVGVDYETNNREVLDGREIDILAGGVGIEVDGLYWHSAKFIPDKNYHQQKHVDSRTKGISLVQFYDMEINTKFPIVTSMLRAKLGLPQRKIYARLTTVGDVDSTVYRKFLEENHLQGSINSRIRRGLYLDNELVSVIGLSTRFGVTTVDRFATVLNTQVIGGFTKLLKSCGVTGTVRSHSANRYSTGELYESTGFTLLREIPYTLNYTDNRELYTRHRFQKHRLSDMFPDYSGESVDEFLQEKGIHPIYGAGTKTWEIEL